MYRTLIESTLLKNNILSETDLEWIKSESHKENITIENFIVQEDYISNQNLLSLIADELGLEFTSMPLALIQEEALNLLSEDYARKHLLVPLYLKDGTLYIATHQPFNFDLLEEVAMMSAYDTEAVIAPLEAIQSCINRVYAKDHVEEEIEKDLGLSEEDANLIERVESAPIVKLVNSIIFAAFEDNASDIHIDAEELLSTVRFRVDGELSHFMNIRHESHDAIVTRIKIMANMNIAEKRNPQDGALRVDLHKETIDLRVASIPTRYGEKIVLRILGNEKGVDYNIEALQMNETMRQYLKSLITMPNGIILITGPTGSGKTTTLYSMLNEIATPDKSVITIEDPVEKDFKGITQVGINTKAGLSFASGLRSILRLDPDVIMIGEIRDSETAAISIRAAITGHLVLSTLHTNDALSSITRLIDMGTEHYMVASSVKSVIAQRLVRKNCEYCKKEVAMSHEDDLLMQDPNLFTYLKGEGCDACENTGYKGRIAIFEAIPIDTKLQTMISLAKSCLEMQEYVKSKNIPLLKDDLIRLIKLGQTSISEARKVLFSNELFNTIEETIHYETN